MICLSKAFARLDLVKVKRFFSSLRCRSYDVVTVDASLCLSHLKGKKTHWPITILNRRLVKTGLLNGLFLFEDVSRVQCAVSSVVCGASI